MPELPEVEGFRRRLAPLIVGRRLTRLEVRDPKLWHPATGLSEADVAGRGLQDLQRRAKLLIFSLEGELALVAHLKIAGQLVYAWPDGRRLVGGHPYPLPDAELPQAATRFVLAFQEGGGGATERYAPGAGSGTLFINDQRRFAWLRLLPAPALAAFVAAQRYGPDPLDPSFTPEVLGARLQARRGRPVKAALLDQTCVAGLGNIYADEALHGARLHPMLRARDLSPEEVVRLYHSIRRVLEVAVPVGGALVKVGRAVAGEGHGPSAEGRDFLRAHGRAGQLCPTCAVGNSPIQVAGQVAVGEGRAPAAPGGAPRIVRLFLAGRGTYFCPVCQPAPPGFAPPAEGDLTLEPLAGTSTVDED